VPKTPERFLYDADGNFTRDGHWNYGWDAENRLIARTNNASAAPAQVRQSVFQVTMAKQSLLHLALGLALIMAGWFTSMHLRMVHRARVHAEGTTLMRINGVCNLISRTAAISPEAFISATGAGIVTVATGLPPSVLDPEAVAAPQEQLYDVWGGPFQVSVVPTATNATQRVIEYQLRVWSTRPNRKKGPGGGEHPLQSARGIECPY
jgi:hypothetical protein